MDPYRDGVSAALRYLRSRLAGDNSPRPVNPHPEYSDHGIAWATGFDGTIEDPTVRADLEDDDRH